MKINGALHFSPSYVRHICHLMIMEIDYCRCDTFDLIPIWHWTMHTLIGHGLEKKPCFRMWLAAMNSIDDAEQQNWSLIHIVFPVAIYVCERTFLPLVFIFFLLIFLMICPCLETRIDHESASKEKDLKKNHWKKIACFYFIWLCTNHSS